MSPSLLLMVRRSYTKCSTTPARYKPYVVRFFKEKRTRKYHKTGHARKYPKERTHP